MKTIIILPQSIPRIAVELAGGGYTVQQTARAMEYERALRTAGKLCIKLHGIKTNIKVQA